jgi:hypothetical protein
MQKYLSLTIQNHAFLFNLYHFSMALRVKSLTRLQRLQFSSFHDISNFQNKNIIFIHKWQKELKSMKSLTIYPCDNIPDTPSNSWLHLCSVHWNGFSHVQFYIEAFEKRVYMSSIFLLYCQYRWERTYTNSFISHSEKKQINFIFITHKKNPAMWTTKPS